jgi:hypothetical protein
MIAFFGVGEDMGTPYILRKTLFRSRRVIRLRHVLTAACVLTSFVFLFPCHFIFTDYCL